MKINHIFKILIVGVFFLTMLSVMNPIVVKANEMYFDDEGNLYFHTRDRKASGGVKYMTIGWVIKRYDMPKDAAGQQYVIVTKSNYKADEEDPSDSAYVLSYFKTSKDEILDAVKSVSTEWYNILVKYGDDVYIDSVMTVVESGDAQGSLHTGGRYEGEVYMTYEGIANARGWASPESLKSHYDLVITFPQLLKPKVAFFSTVESELVDFSSSVMSSFIMGEGEYGQEQFDIGDGIPSGEKLYLKGAVDKAFYKLTLKKVTERYTADVAVPVTYILKWTDYYGVAQEETRVIYRYYRVDRDFTYYEFVDFDVYNLDGIKLDGSVLGDNTGKAWSEETELQWNVYKYYGTMGHFRGCDVEVLKSVETVTLTGKNGLKPAIPDADYSSYTSQALGEAYVRNDRVVINGQVVLSDEVCVKKGKTPQTSATVDSINVYYKDIVIPKDTKNGKYEDMNVELTYINEDGENTVYTIDNFTTVMVHTPVRCQGKSAGDITFNQALKPTTQDVVLGEGLAVTFSELGAHRDILGYRVRSYMPYVGMRQICCPFAVIYKGVRYEKDTWITVDGYSVKLIVCEDNDEGEYKVRIRTLAYNGNVNMGDNVYEEEANLSAKNYGAFDEVKVRLIGRLRNLQIKYGDEVYSAKDMPVAIELASDSLYSISIDTVGDMEQDDYVDIAYTYFHEGKEGALIPVDVYGVTGRDFINELVVKPLKDKESLISDTGKDSNYKATWTTANQVYEELIVVPEGTSLEEIKLVIEDDRTEELFITEGSVIVCADIVSYKDGKPYLSYINEENSKKGYCNMWLTEGGTEKYPYGAIVRLKLGDYTYYDYEVSGTH